jgi:hypothetical protein
MSLLSKNQFYFFISFFYKCLQNVLFLHPSLLFKFNIYFYFSCGRRLSITNLIIPTFQKMCGNCHVIDVIICSMGDVHCSACHSKSKVHKSCFFKGSIATNDWFILLSIEGNQFEAIMHMTKFEFLKLVCPKQVQSLVSIHVCCKFQL